MIINLSAIRVQRGGRPYRDPRTLATPAGPAHVGERCVVTGYGVGVLVAVTGTVGVVKIAGEEITTWGCNVTPIVGAFA